MCVICDSFKKRTGYAGQKYVVLYTRDGVESRMGWQNQASGGLEDAAKMMPGVTATRMAQVECCQIEYGNKHCGGECTCHICAPDLHERDRQAEIEHRIKENYRQTVRERTRDMFGSGPC